MYVFNDMMCMYSYYILTTIEKLRYVCEEKIVVKYNFTAIEIIKEVVGEMLMLQDTNKMLDIFRQLVFLPHYQ